MPLRRLHDGNVPGALLPQGAQLHTMPSSCAGGAPAKYRTYQLIIEVRRPLWLQVGRLGTFRFPAGRYVYTGSARRSLEARIARHLSSRKRLRWHIDYLLAQRAVKVVRVRRSRLDECQLNRSVRGATPAAGFGASDCEAGCGSHLKYRGPLPLAVGQRP
jgi:Uri superfamily endonuclease